MSVVVLLGAPGAGKGTQAPVLVEALGLPYVATGDLFRSAVRAGSALGLAAKGYMDRGELVPDKLTIGLLLERLSAPDARKGVVLDGFPRTRAQAQALDEALAAAGGGVERALYIEVAEEELVSRLAGRWICRAEGHPYHERFAPPLRAGICDLDGSELYQRTDDRLETVEARLSIQLPPLREVVAHYRDRGLLATVDGAQPVETVSKALLRALEVRT